MPPFPGLIGGSGTTTSVILDAEETINLIVEKAQSPHAQSEGALVPTPGFTPWSVVPQVGSRGLTFVANTRMFGVVGGRFYEWDGNGIATDRGPVAADANPVQFAYSGIGGQVGIAAGGNVYCFTLATNTLSAALLTGGYTHLAFAGGFGFAFSVLTGKTLVSAPDDLSTWDPGTFFQRGLFADPLQAMFADENNLIWCIGTDTFEVRYNSGVGTQPWIPLSGLVGPYGIAAPFGYGLSAAGNFWIVRNPQGSGRFVVSKGGVPVPVGTYAIDNQIDHYLSNGGVSDSEVFIYDQGGHTAASIAFPTAQAMNPTTPGTFSFDVEAQTWTKRGFWNSAAAKWQLWAPRTHVLAFGKHLVGDRSTGTIWQMDPAIATDVDGTGIRRLRRTPHLNSEHARIPLDRIELLMDTGLAVQSGQGSNPQVMLRLSRDGGRTWGNERIAGLGSIGQYRKRVMWTQLGAPSDAVFEISYSEPTPFRIVAGWLNNTDGQPAATPAGRAA